MAARRKKKTAAKAKNAKRGSRGPEVTLNHAIVYVFDLERALQFYGDRLGLPLIDRHENAYARLRTGGGGTLGLHMLEQGQQVSADGIRLYFEVKNLEKFCAKLQNAGVVFSKPPKMMPWGWQHAYLNDPDGHEISLYWAGKKRFQKTIMARSANA
jgi:catechol 2,3-dioxygenase-like lactoylglutathione lyase family enzyme